MITALNRSRDLYFRGEAERYIFFLLELDGKPRLDKLGVNLMHYKSKGVAEAWRAQIAKVIHPDICSHPLAGKAMTIFNDMYRGMIK